MNSIRNFLMVAVGFLCCASASQAAGYKIKAQITGLKDTTLLLGHHFGKKKYVVDTITLDSKGSGVFEGDSLLDGGIYLVITPGMDYFEILLDKDQEFEVKTDTANLIKNLEFKGSADNLQFVEYQNFMVEKQKRSHELRTELKDLVAKDSLDLSKKERAEVDANVEKTKNELKAVEKEIDEYWNKIINDKKGGLLSSILMAMKDVNIPEAPKDENGVVTDSSFQFKYYQSHFFDNVDFSDSRLLRTPILESKIDAYFKRAIAPIPDSIIVGVDHLIEKASANPKVYKYAVQYIFNQYNDNKIMGMDRVFVHVAEKYYLSGKADWALTDSAFMAKINERVTKMKPNLIGETAPELRLYNDKNQVQSLHSIDADYLVVYFFEPGCGHCKKIIPQFHKLYQDMDTAKVKVALIYTQVEPKDWHDFIEKHDLHDCVNLYDPYQLSNFRNLYDIYSTPTSYVLDKDKKIIAKRIGPDTIADFVGKMIETDQGKK